ncbi:hypothetical protein [Yersinia alsatica]|uniref:hypothetical protein n=1 Tax=Yersinia alsatica TaxID=2890317 RepID=UPI00067A9209|nr:hypothetical protein [Yersinia alsatica]
MDHDILLCFFTHLYQGKAMKITGKHEGDLVLKSDLDLRGMVCGQLIVSDGCRAEVRGMVGGHLTVEQGGLLILRGMACHGLTNSGGTVEIFGMVTGGLNEIAGTTKVHLEAKID